MLQEKRLFLFDIDGTLALGDALFDGSKALLQYIEQVGGMSYFITNNSTKSGADYVKKFKKWGIDTAERQFITAGYLTIRYLKAQFAGQKIFVVGTRSFVSELRGQGLRVTERPEPDVGCVLVAFDNELTYQKAADACALLQRQPEIPFLATNPDLRCPVPFGFVPDCGAICNLITGAVDRAPKFLGKPSEEVVALCLADSGFRPEQTLVVGDRLYTDIACGIAGGVETCVLFTGEAKPEDLPNTAFPPTYAFETVRGLLEQCRDGAERKGEGRILSARLKGQNEESRNPGTV